MALAKGGHGCGYHCGFSAGLVFCRRQERLPPNLLGDPQGTRVWSPPQVPTGQTPTTGRTESATRLDGLLSPSAVLYFSPRRSLCGHTLCPRPPCVLQPMLPRPSTLPRPLQKWGMLWSPHSHGAPCRLINACALLCCFLTTETPVGRGTGRTLHPTTLPRNPLPPMHLYGRGFLFGSALSNTTR